MARWGIQLTGVPLGFVEQLYTFGDIDRDPQAAAAGERRLSIAGAAWDLVRSLERYECLFEAGLLPESGGSAKDPDVWGTPAALDHRRILTSALERARGKLTYRPVVFELMPPRFTLSIAFDPAIRKIIYTTNAIESLNYQLRKVTKTKGHFPTADAVLKIFYLAICGIGNHRGGELGTHTQGWRQALNAFTIAFPGRIDITTY